MSKENQEENEKELGFVQTPDGKLKIVKNFTVKTEDRVLTLIFLEDETTIINVKRFKESKEEPYMELITDQTMRLSKLTIALLMVCLTEANSMFALNIDGIIAELNAKINNERDS